MNKITYTKHCEFCGTEFTTPIHLRRYCSKSCVRAAYRMRLKEKLKSDAVKTLERSHGLMPEVCYFSVTQTASILGLSRMSVYRMINDGRLKATRLSSRATRISREDIESTMIAQRLFSPADFYTFNLRLEYCHERDAYVQFQDTLFAQVQALICNGKHIGGLVIDAKNYFDKAKAEMLERKKNIELRLVSID